MVTPHPADVVLTPDAVTGGTSSRGEVTLSGPAPAGGLAVTLSSNRTAVAEVTTPVRVAEGQLSAPFDVTTKPVTQTAQVEITATRAGVSQKRQLTVDPAPIALSSLSFEPSAVNERVQVKVTVSLSGPAPAGGIEVELLSSNEGLARVPPSISVAAGQSSANFSFRSRKCPPAI